MRRQVALYIGGTQADLSAASLVQLNFKAEDYEKPTAVRISYTQQIILPGTPTNTQIFGNFVRSDRSGGTFDHLARTPFTLMDDAGLTIESGYCKLDKVKRSGDDVTYSVTLYGGLGGFLYSLMYGGGGDKLTLAALDWTTAGGPQELTFTMGAAAVSQAWTDLLAGTPGKWQAVNFAPCYNGIPSDFDAKKVLVHYPSANAEFPGMFPPTWDGKAPYNGYILAEMAKEWDEWKMRDLRSYLQRPCWSVRAFFDALSRFANAAGYALKLDHAFFAVSNPYYANAWVTLPLISPANKSQAASVSPSLSGGPLAGSGYITVDFDDQPSDTKMTAVILLNITADGSAFVTPPAELQMYDFKSVSENEGCAFFIQAVAYDGNGDIVGAGPAQLVTDTADHLGQASGFFSSAPDVAALFGYTPIGGAAFVNDIIRASFAQRIGDPDTYDLSQQLSVGIECYGAAEIRIHVTTLWHYFEREPNDGHGYSTTSIWQKDITFRLYDKGADINKPCPLSFALDPSSVFSLETSGLVRSGYQVTKADIFNGSASPGEWLLDYCKTFGLFLVIDKDDNSVSILRRDTFFQGGSVIDDLTDRVDISSGMEVTPTVAPSRFLTFSPDVGGTFAEDYKTAFGKNYGSKTVDTGYSFDADTKDLTDKNGIRGGVEALDESDNYNDPSINGETRLNWQRAGYKLTYGAGETASAEVDAFIPDAQSDWGMAKYLDVFPKLHACDKDGKGVDGDNVLLFFDGKTDDYFPDFAAQPYRLTDDASEMYAMNDGKPCWLLLGSHSTDLTAIPFFSRYMRIAYNKAKLQMDYGTPRALYDRLLTEIGAGSDIFSQFWADFLADRYARDTRAVRVKVNLSGLRVDGSLLRRFYYFDGAIWCLLAVENYGPQVDETTWCQFVKVQDTDNYGVTPTASPRISLNASALTIPATGGSVTVVVTSNGEWQAANVPAFVTLDITSGGTAGADTQTVVTITAGPNGGSELADLLSFEMVADPSVTAGAQVVQPEVSGTAYRVIAADCIGCGACVGVCPVAAITLNGVASIDGLACIGCGSCAAVCPTGAIVNS